MTTRLYEIMIYCIKSEITDSDVKFDFCLSDDEIEQLYEISQRHDLSHIIGNALINNKILQFKSELYDKYQKRIMLSLYRYEQSNYEFGEIVKLFEREGIRFIPLKGVVLRELYPLPWMRTSCDIDILIEKENIDRATECLLDFGLKKGVESPHDITFITSSGCHIELHHSLIEDGLVYNLDCVLSEVWTRSTVRDGYLFWHDMNDEMFYFYHIAHMAKHFLFGGCGIKPFIDLWILDNLDNVDYCKRNELLAKGALLKFANAARNLSQVWFGNNEMDSLSRQLEIYIFKGGVYGSTENRISTQQQKKGGKLKYIVSRIFLPYDVIKFHYPILQKRRWLTPFMEIRRWFTLIFCGRAKRVLYEMRFSNNISSAEEKKTQAFLNNIGL